MWRVWSVEGQPELFQPRTHAIGHRRIVRDT
jgi:hypothetical protein